MEIGILTYHRSHNYGALLQAVALRHILVMMGHSVYFVNYWPEYHRQMYAQFSISEALRRGGKRGAVKYVVEVLRYYSGRKERIRHFQSFIDEMIMPYCIGYDRERQLDIVLYGSDQIWRKQVGLGSRFNPVYFGNNLLSAKKNISYAASMGCIELNQLDKKFLKEKLMLFDKISVREDSLSAVLHQLGIASEVVLDPTLLLNREEWNRLLPVERECKEKYVLYYRLLEKSFDEEQIKRFAKCLGCTLIILDGRIKELKKDTFSTSGPKSFVALIKYAEFVFTSSFHGVVFSLIYNKNFFASFSVNSGRAKSLLNRLGLQRCLLEPCSPIDEKYLDIDYMEVNNKLENYREESIKFLSEL